MNWFGKKKKETAPSTTSGGTKTASNPANTVIQLRQAIKNQEKREEHIQRKIDAMGVEAKAKMAKKDKKGAMYCMKRRKLHEQELDKISNVKMTLETQVMQLESAAQNAETFAVMKAGKNELNKIHNEVGIDKVDDLMEDITEAIEAGNEINAAMAVGVDPLVTDEDELMAELEAMDADELESDLLQPAKVNEDIALPDVPDAALPTLNNAEAEEMKKLEAELAGL